MVDLNLRRAKLSPNEKLTVNKFPFNFVLFCWFGFGFVLGIFGFFCHELRLIWNDFCCCCCCRCRLVNCMQHLTEKQPKKEIKKWIVRPSFGWEGKWVEVNATPHRICCSVSIQKLSQCKINPLAFHSGVGENAFTFFSQLRPRKLFRNALIIYRASN